LRTDRPAEAEASLERALRYRSAYPEAEMALGLAQLRTGRPEAARQTLERILERYPGSEMADRARRSLAALDQPVG
jgi:TolA-binding protein